MYLCGCLYACVYLLVLDSCFDYFSIFGKDFAVFRPPSFRFSPSLYLCKSLLLVLFRRRQNTLSLMSVCLFVPLSICLSVYLTLPFPKFQDRFCCLPVSVFASLSFCLYLRLRLSPLFISCVVPSSYLVWLPVSLSVSLSDSFHLFP